MNKRVYEIAGTVMLIISIIMYFIYWGDDFVLEKGRFPFVCNKAENYTISHFENSYPPNKILIIGGVYKSGKSRALQELSKRYLSLKQLPVEIHISRANTFDNLVDLVKSDLVRNFMTLSKTLPRSKMEEFSQMNWKTRAFNEKHGELGNGFAGAQLAAENALEMLHNNKTIIDGLNELLDVLERINDILPVNIFIHSADKIKELKTKDGQNIGKVIMDYALKYFENHYKKHSTIRIALEVIDSRIIAKVKDINGVFVVVLKEIDNPLQTMHSLGIFRHEEGKPIYKLVGGQTAALYHAFMEKKYGTNPYTIAKMHFDEDFAEVKKLMTNTSNTAWFDLCFGPLYNATNISFLDSLFKEGYVYSDENSTTYAGSAAVRAAFCAITPKKYKPKEIKVEKPKSKGKKSKSPSQSPSPKPTPTSTPTPSPSATPVQSAKPSPSVSPPNTPSPSPTPVPSVSPSPSPSPKPEKKSGWFSKKEKPTPKPKSAEIKVETKADSKKVTPEKKEEKKVETKSEEKKTLEKPKDSKKQDQAKPETTQPIKVEDKSSKVDEKKSKEEAKKMKSSEKKESKGWFSKKEKQTPTPSPSKSPVPSPSISPSPKPEKKEKATPSPSASPKPAKKSGWFSKK
ncbi:hypothetical protein TVAG_263350 [Trichomonas vaginalis G3]|uniref:Uncharacterized protein n=1 Tax=Trichomonas vaginalis (strain ATCC PRA-98 / G3) TaxID=412133 RepID=A2FA82_TRIV3|nr:keratinocyte proline-rich protein-related family [Trichomonas vaginalis G3]EAX98218.1 hypothetical protein TVAG_263350 [Trichomonas vaginalis G3]KAI5533976.1 keratinocyte proline-rich protein-related family [Trichomonas vaginalis G3]|eukprot:XP_001311148.1 hypothetical protein [Trichomonas vaginalis G3]